MPTPIKVDDDIYNLIREDSEREQRSIAGQAEYYMRIGRAICRSPFFSQEDIDRALSGNIEVGELSAAEQEAFFQEYATRMENGGMYTAGFWEDRQQRGLGVGALEDGTLVRQLPGGGYEVLTAA